MSKRRINEVCPYDSNFKREHIEDNIYPGKILSDPSWPSNKFLHLNDPLIKCITLLLVTMQDSKIFIVNHKHQTFKYKNVAYYRIYYPHFHINSFFTNKILDNIQKLDSSINNVLYMFAYENKFNEYDCVIVLYDTNDINNNDFDYTQLGNSLEHNKYTKYSMSLINNLRNPIYKDNLINYVHNKNNKLVIPNQIIMTFKYPDVLNHNLQQHFITYNEFSICVGDVTINNTYETKKLSVNELDQCLICYIYLICKNWHESNTKGILILNKII